MKRIIYIVAAILALSCLLVAMVGCKKEKEPEYGDYTVTVVDGLNNPISNVVVKFTYPDGTVKSRITEDSGVVSIKNVELGDYKVTLEKGFSNAVIDVAEYSLTKDNTNLNVVLRDETNTINIYGSIEDGSYASVVDESEYSVPCTADKTSYLIFTAKKTGIYKISIADMSEDVTVGYYGIPLFVLDYHCADGEYDGKSFEIIIQDHNTPYVFGISSESTKDVDFKIERIADAPFDPEYVDWKMMEKTSDIGKCTISEDATLINFDLEDPSLKVVERDGLYYTADGKQVYIRITTGNVAYLGGASLALLAGYVSDQVGVNIGGYIYNENGSFVEKRNYNLMIEDYMELCDGKYGVVPLTTELAECIKLHGESNGWWNPTSPNYLFSEIDLNAENAWLFLCMIEV